MIEIREKFKIHIAGLVGHEREDTVVWDGFLKPIYKPFSKGSFGFQILFVDFPRYAPRVILKTLIYHPNISKTGQVKLRELDTWKVEKHMDLVVGELIEVIDNVNAREPIREDVAHEFLNDRKQFCLKAEEFTRKFAHPREFEY
jgi:ubiquitin-protein ligase